MKAWQNICKFCIFQDTMDKISGFVKIQEPKLL